MPSPLQAREPQNEAGQPNRWFCYVSYTKLQILNKDLQIDPRVLLERPGRSVTTIERPWAFCASPLMLGRLSGSRGRTSPPTHDLLPQEGTVIPEGRPEGGGGVERNRSNLPNFKLLVLGAECTDFRRIGCAGKLDFGCLRFWFLENQNLVGHARIWHELKSLEAKYGRSCSFIAY